tara:strand:+ start:926 stop:1030 length:105 start_codon:yes stop_codon:yes gene_type:complete
MKKIITFIMSLFKGNSQNEDLLRNIEKLDKKNKK